MASQLTVAKVGGGVIDLTGFAPALAGLKGAPYFEGNQSLIELGMRFANGEAAQGTFKVVDPTAEIAKVDFTYNLPAHKIVTWTEDAPGAAIWLFRGRIPEYEGGRGHAVVDNFVEFDVTANDINRDLRYQAFTEEWVRPAETDVARLVALDAYTLSGASSTATDHGDDFEITISTTHLAPDTNTVVMPAKTYPVGTQPQDVIQDCADAAGKVFGVVPHHVGGSHACLRYHLESDHSVHPSAIRISDNLADWDPEDLTAPVYEPHWEAGKATLFDGGQLLSGLVSIGSFGSVFVEYPQNVTDYGYAVEAYYDSTSTTIAQAEVVANGILSKRRLTHLTHRVSIIMLPEQVDLVAVGQSLEIKAAAAIGGQYLDTWQTRRVAECKFEPRLDGRYWAHLNLDRQPRSGPSSPGAAQPASTSPKPPPICQPDDPGGIGDPVANDVFCESGGTVGDCGPITQPRCWSGSSESFTAYGAVTPGFYYSELQVTTKYGGYSPTVFRVVIRDTVTSNPQFSIVLGSETLVQCRDGGDWVTLGGAFEVPTGYDNVRFGLLSPGGKAVREGSHTFNEYTPPASPVENDPYCVPADAEGDSSAGTSPYFLPSDAPILTSDDAHLTTKLQERVINNSGGELEVGDVVVPDPTFDGFGVTTTTTANSTASMVGVVQVGAPDDEEMVVAWSGVMGYVNDGASTAADGDYLYTSTTAGAAQTSGTRSTGAVGRVVRDDSGDPLYTLWWGVPDSAGGVATRLTTSQVDMWSDSEDDVLKMKSLDANSGVYFLIQPNGVPTTGDTSWHVYYSRVSEGAAHELFLGAGAWHGMNMYLIASGDAFDTTEPLPIRVIMERGTTHYPVMDWDTDSTVLFYQHLRLSEIAAPSTPASGEAALYVKTDGHIYLKNDAGTEYDLTDAGTHLTDTTDAHDASAISIVDAGSYFTGTEVEAALQELGADVAAGGAAGHYEVVVSGTAPPVAVTNIAEDDWIYGWVPD